MADLTSKDLASAHVRKKTLTHPNRAVQIRRALLDGTNPPNNPPVSVTGSKQKVYVLIWYMWAKGTDFILD